MAEGFAISRSLANLALEQLEADILNFIREHDCVTFPELQARYGGRGHGDSDLVLPKYENIVLWRGLSEDLATAITNLCVRGDMHWHESSPVMYWPRPLILPLAHWPISQEYKTPHWLSICFRAGKSCELCELNRG